MSKLKARPTALPSTTVRVPTAVGTAFITITFDSDEPAEVFVNLGKGGTESFAMAEALGRLISALLRLEKLGTVGERMDIVINQLHGIGGTAAGRAAPSVPDAVATALCKATKGGDER